MHRENWINTYDYQFKKSDLAFQEMFNYANTLIAWNTITPIFYMGVIAGSEFLTYDADKLYVCLEFKAGYSVSYQANPANIQFYDENNANAFYLNMNTPYWDATAALVKFANQAVFMNNFYFGRILQAVNNYMCFNGYKLEII